MPLIALILLVLAVPAYAEDPSPSQREQVVQRELVTRIQEEMGKAISCQVTLDATRAELQKAHELNRKPADSNK